MQLEAIVFDFDGVLVESVEVKGDAFVKLYKNEKPELQKQILDYHHENGGMSRYDKLRYYESVLLGRKLSDQKLEELAQKFSDIVESQVIAAPWVKGAQEFLEKNLNTIPMFVASATPQEELLRISKKRNMGHYFREILGTPIMKSEHLCNIIKFNNYKAENVLMIGDAMSDYNAAKLAKTAFLGRQTQHIQPFPLDTSLMFDLTELSDFLEEKFT